MKIKIPNEVRVAPTAVPTAKILAIFSFVLYSILKSSMYLLCFTSI